MRISIAKTVVWSWDQSSCQTWFYQNLILSTSSGVYIELLEAIF